MPLGDRLRHHHHKRRLVRSGDLFTSDELEHDEVELEEVPPSPEQDPDDEVEPWAWGDKVMPPVIAERLRAYQEFVSSREGGA